VLAAESTNNTFKFAELQNTSALIIESQFGIRHLNGESFLVAMVSAFGLEIAKLQIARTGTFSMPITNPLLKIATSDVDGNIGDGKS